MIITIKETKGHIEKMQRCCKSGVTLTIRNSERPEDWYSMKISPQSEFVSEGVKFQ